eukprot:6200044-Pleurochrysis_carterae.AAC.2
MYGYVRACVSTCVHALEYWCVSEAACQREQIAQSSRVGARAAEKGDSERDGATSAASAFAFSTLCL